MVDLAHDLIEAAGVATPILIYLIASKKKTKKEQDAMHVENQKKLDELISERVYLIPHDHVERSGVLEAEGIIRRKANGK